MDISGTPIRRAVKPFSDLPKRADFGASVVESDLAAQHRGGDVRQTHVAGPCPRFEDQEGVFGSAVSLSGDHARRLKNVGRVVAVITHCGSTVPRRARYVTNPVDGAFSVVTRHEDQHQDQRRYREDEQGEHHGVRRYAVRVRSESGTSHDGLLAGRCATVGVG